MVTQTILESGLLHAPAGARITDLYLVIGELSSFVDDSVQFYWDLISAGTAAAGAKLHFRRVAAQMACGECDHRYSPREALTCPRCGSHHATITAGEEFYLEAIEIERDGVEVQAKQ